MNFSFYMIDRDITSCVNQKKGYNVWSVDSCTSLFIDNCLF